MNTGRIIAQKYVFASTQCEIINEQGLYNLFEILTKVNMVFYVQRYKGEYGVICTMLNAVVLSLFTISIFYRNHASKNIRILKECAFL